MSQLLSDLQWVDIAIRNRWCDEDVAEWERVYDKLEVLAKTAHDTGSPKLPTHKEVYDHIDKTLHLVGEREHAVLSAAYDFIARQLPAVPETLGKTFHRGTDMALDAHGDLLLGPPPLSREEFDAQVKSAMDAMAAPSASAQNANVHLSVSRGIVWCITCGRSVRVDADMCVKTEWPTCCGFTMRLESPEERAERDKCPPHEYRQCLFYQGFCIFFSGNPCSRSGGFVSRSTGKPICQYNLDAIRP